MSADKNQAARESSLVSGWTVEGQMGLEQPSTVEESLETAEVAPDDTDTQLSSGALVVAGLVGGIYLLYTMAWFSWANHYSQVFAMRAGGVLSIDVVLQQILFWLVPLAPALWLASALMLNRRHRMRQALWLLVGLVVLFPLPVLFEATVPAFIGGSAS